MHVVLADHSLTDFVGHSFEYARSLRRHIESLGHRVQVLATRWVADDVQSGVGAIPCFKYGFFHSFPLPRLSRVIPRRWRGRAALEWRYRRNAWAVCDDLRRVEPIVVPGPQSLIIFPTVGWPDVLPVVRWLERQPQDSRPRVALVFHFTADSEATRETATAEFYRRAFRYLERSPVRASFRLFADSSALAEEYAEYTRLPVTVVPIPHTDLHAAGAEGSPARGPLRLTYLGDARIDKGFHLLPRLLERLSPRLAGGSLRAELQANVRNPHEWEVRSAVRRMRRMSGVDLHEQPLSTGEYYRLLARADIVLLPYISRTYRAQTSGVFAEALSQGKPVVVPRGTWMARELRDRAGGLTFLPEDEQSLFETVSAAIDDWPALSRQASGRAADWRARHNPAAYFNVVSNAFAEVSRS